MMTEDTLKLAVGASAQLQLTVPKDSPRETVRIIGYVPGGSLVVTRPTVNGNMKIVREGQVYRVRMLLGESVAGFEAKVLSVAFKPYPHMHLQYPKQFAQMNVRNSARVTTDIPCTIRDTSQPDSEEDYRPARIVDLSETGAKISAEMALGDPGNVLQIRFKLDVLDIEESLVLVGNLRHVRERLDTASQPKQHTYLHGLQFTAVNRIQQIMLHAWVMEQIVTGAGDIG